MRLGFPLAPHLAAWSSGMILAQGARGPGLNSRSSPLTQCSLSFYASITHEFILPSRIPCIGHIYTSGNGPKAGSSSEPEYARSAAFAKNLLRHEVSFSETETSPTQKPHAKWAHRVHLSIYGLASAVSFSDTEPRRHRSHPLNGHTGLF